MLDNSLPNFDERNSSQMSAIIQLINLGYSLMSNEQSLKYRKDSSHFILTNIAFQAIKNINSADISDKSIYDALADLEDIKLDNGIVKASESIFSNLISGVGVSENIRGNKSSPQLKFVDWKNFENNVFHVVPEFTISDNSDCRPDIVLFVNGIPFAVIENKKPSVPVDEAVFQMIRNQSDNFVPRFFVYTQILVATNLLSFKYGTMATPKDFYSVWKENLSDEDKRKVLLSVNSKVSADDLALLKNTLAPDYKQIDRNNVTEQDIGIYSILRPERILELVKHFILYDGGVKKITRYHQYLAIKKTLIRVSEVEENGKRKGGLIWHTQGSGKSLTMVMLVKYLIDNFNNPRIVVVTDRVELDSQINGVFEDCNIKKKIVRAKSGADLLAKLKDKSSNIITTLVHKFNQSTDFVDNDNNIFVLIDEAHRTQAGDANTMMNIILPKACQLAFTGTPLMSKDKSISIEKFGGLIDAYTISEAEADGAVLPLIYQGRFINQTVKSDIDLYYNQITNNLTDDEKRKIEEKYLSQSVLEQTSARIDMIAYDINNHYVTNFKGTGLKGQIVAPSKYSAILFKEALDGINQVKSEVVISDTNYESSDGDTEQQKRYVAEFLEKEKKLKGDLNKREKEIRSDFIKNPDGCELLIVVDKLLTGFDAPRNTVLYLARQLKDHNLLQAIARVNRVYSGNKNKQMKTAGLIIDYSRNAENIKNALELFSNYDKDDVFRALLDTDEQISNLEKIYHKLHSLFDDIEDKNNIDAYVNFLKNDEYVRNEYYEEVNNFIKNFAFCCSLYDFYNKFDSEKLNKYKSDLKKFIELKKVTQLALSQKVDFSKYKDQIFRILNDYITADEVELLSKEIKLSDVAEFNEYIENEKNGLSVKSKAEAIAAQTKDMITLSYKQDEQFYSKFSDRVNEILEDLKNDRYEDILVLFDELKDIQTKVSLYQDDDIPNDLNDIVYHPFYRNIKTIINYSISDNDYIYLIKVIVNTVKKYKKVDWWSDSTVQRNIKIDLTNLLIDKFSDFDNDTIISISDKVWQIAVDNKNII